MLIGDTETTFNSLVLDPKVLKGKVGSTRVLAYARYVCLHFEPSLWLYLNFLCGQEILLITWYMSCKPGHLLYQFQGREQVCGSNWGYLLSLAPTFCQHYTSVSKAIWIDTLDACPTGVGHRKYERNQHIKRQRNIYRLCKFVALLGSHNWERPDWSYSIQYCLSSFPSSKVII